MVYPGADEDSLQQCIDRIAEKVAANLVTGQETVSFSQSPPDPRRTREIRLAIEEGVEELRSDGLGGEEITDYLENYFFTFKEKLEQSKTSKSLFIWTLIQNLISIPVLVLFLAYLIPQTLFPEGLGSISNTLLIQAAIALTTTVGPIIYRLLSPLEIHGGHLIKTRLLLFRSKYPISQIQEITFAKTHLFGKRQVFVSTADQKVELSPNRNFFPAAAFSLSFLQTEMKEEVRDYLRHAWIKQPRQNLSHTAIGISLLLIANLLWFLNIEDIWIGNGITWYSLISFVLLFIAIISYEKRFFNPAQITACKLMILSQLTLIFLFLGWIIGYIEFVRISLLFVSFCMIFMFITIFCRSKLLLSSAFFLAVSAPVYLSVQLYQDTESNILYQSQKAAPIQMISNDHGYYHLDVNLNTESKEAAPILLGYTDGSVSREISFSESGYSFFPSRTHQVYLTNAALANAPDNAVMIDVTDPLSLTEVKNLPQRWVYGAGNNPLVWSPNEEFILLRTYHQP